MSCPLCKSKIEQAQHFNRIRISQRDPDKLMTHDNTLVHIDGQLIYGVEKLRIEMDQDGYGKVEIYLKALIDMNTALVKDAAIITKEDIR